MNESSLKVSVVVPTYRRPALLARCLETLANQYFAFSDYEVVIVHDGPDAETAQLVSETSARITGFRLRFLHLQRQQGPAAARNLGWKSATGQLILFTDDDCLADYSWIGRYWNAFKRSSHEAFSGRVVVPIGGVPTDYEKSMTHLETAFFVTANCACPKEILVQTGGFDENFGAAWREDSDFYFTLIDAGYPVSYIESARILHPVRQAPWGISLRLEKKNRYDALLYKKHPQLFRKYIRRQPAFSYYCMILLLFTCLISLFFHFYLIAGLSACAWLFLVLRFVSKRLHGTRHTPEHIGEMFATSVLIPFLSVFWTLYGSLTYRKLLW